MQKICSKALLISCVPNFIKHITEIAQDAGVEIEVVEEWNTAYRLDAEVIICGSRYLPQISTLDYNKVRLVLKTTETVAPFVEMGITHFIFDYTNVKEVAYSFYAEERVETIEDYTVESILCHTQKDSFVTSKYNFNFSSNVFKYNGVGIYLKPSEKKYLAKWLLLGIKENDKRILLCKMRKKFDRDFLADINRYGQLIED